MIEKISILMTNSSVSKENKIGETLLAEAKRRIEDYIALDMVLGACLFHPLMDWNSYPLNAGKKARAIVSCLCN